MVFQRRIAVGLLALGLGISQTGCLKKVLLDGQIKGTREGSAAVNTLHDFEIAKTVAHAGLGQLEGMYKLAPYNTDAMFMLTRGWAGVSFGFIEDDYEAALVKGDTKGAAYHLLRARAGWQRAKHYGKLLLAKRADGFDAVKGNAATLRKWLVDNFTSESEAEELLWIGYAWVGEVGVSKDVPEIVAELYVGAEIVQRSIDLDPAAVNATGYTILGAYHARTAMGELDESLKDFEKAIQTNGGKFLPTKLNLATRYYCAKSDKPNWEKTLHEVLAAPDDLPEARLQNTIAKRRARRYLDNKIFQEDCGFG